MHASCGGSVTPGSDVPVVANHTCNGAYNDRQTLLDSGFDDCVCFLLPPAPFFCLGAKPHLKSGLLALFEPYFEL